VSPTKFNRSLSGLQKGTLLGLAVLCAFAIASAFYGYCANTNQRIEITFAEPIERIAVGKTFQSLAEEMGYGIYGGPGFRPDVQEIEYPNGKIMHSFSVTTMKGWYQKKLRMGPRVSWAHRAEFLDGILYRFTLAGCEAPDEFEQAEISRWEAALRNEFPDASFDVKMRGGYLNSFES